jgi:NTP pyrophosphatase (non-canonical NTP hydrolase)
MTIEELIKTAHDNAKASGWWDEKRNTGELLMLIVSECGEALEAHRGDKRADFDMYEAEMVHDVGFETCFRSYIKDTFEDELADIVIRIADLAGGLGFASLPTRNVIAESNGNVGAQLFEVVVAISQSKQGHIVETEVSPHAIGDVWSLTWGIANAHGIDLWRHIELKMKYNLTRPRKHGKAY